MEAPHPLLPRLLPHRSVLTGPHREHVDLQRKGEDLRDEEAAPYAMSGRAPNEARVWQYAAFARDRRRRRPALISGYRTEWETSSGERTVESLTLLQVEGAGVLVLLAVPVNLTLGTTARPAAAPSRRLAPCPAWLGRGADRVGQPAHVLGARTGRSGRRIGEVTETLSRASRSRADGAATHRPARSSGGGGRDNASKGRATGRTRRGDVRRRDPSGLVSHERDDAGLVTAGPERS